MLHVVIIAIVVIALCLMTTGIRTTHSSSVDVCGV